MWIDILCFKKEEEGILFKEGNLELKQSKFLVLNPDKFKI